MRALILGIAIGAAVGYFLATEDKEELIDNAKSAARKVKDLFTEGVEKGKKLVADYQGNETEPGR